MSAYIVIGAGGSIGSAVVRALRVANKPVYAAVHRYEQLAQFSTQVESGFLDVAEFSLMERFAKRIALRAPVKGVVYSVGHCPPGGVARAVSRPLGKYTGGEYRREVTMHQIGVLTAFMTLLPVLTKGGSFVFLSSAITRMKRRFPEGVFGEAHASVIAAKDFLIDGMRRDPEVVRNGINIHRIAPAAVDTPFHEGNPLNLPLVPLTTVAQAVVEALASSTVVDRELLAE